MEHQLFHVKVSDGRRAVLPAEVCKRLGVEVGGTLIVVLADDNVRLQSFNSMLDDFRALVNSKIPAGVSLVDELTPNAGPRPCVTEFFIADASATNSTRNAMLHHDPPGREFLARLFDDARFIERKLFNLLPEQQHLERIDVNGG